ncbi:MAG: VTT domain-containing protein [Patescibacteria group bacterium]
MQHRNDAMLHFDLSQIIQTVGLLGVAAIVFAESGLLIGFFLPGDSLLFTAGLLASQGVFSFSLLILLSFIAAVAGDSVGYAFGYRIGPRIFTREDSRFFKKAHLEQAHNFFVRYGAQAIVLARFMPIVRTFTPILAGVGKMPYRTFITYNFIGAALWAIGIPTLGFTLGTLVPSIDEYILPIIAGIIVVSFIPPIKSWWQSRKSSRTQESTLG